MRFIDDVPIEQELLYRNSIVFEKIVPIFTNSEILFEKIEPVFVVDVSEVADEVAFEKAEPTFIDSLIDSKFVDPYVFVPTLIFALCAKFF